MAQSPEPPANSDSDGAAAPDAVPETAPETAPGAEPATGPDAGSGDAPDLGAAPADDGSALSALLPADAYVKAVEQLEFWVTERLFTLDVGLQFVLIVAALVPATIFAPRLKAVIQQQIAPRAPFGIIRRAVSSLAHVATPLALYITWQIFNVALKSAGRPTGLITAMLSLLTAWIAIRLVTLIIRSPFWSRVAFYIAWPVAALDAFGALDDVARELDALSIPIGENDSGDPVGLSAMDIVRTGIYFGVLVWGANALGAFIERRIDDVEELTPSIKALLVKIINIVLPVIALLMALQLVGFNLATLTIFGGAIGLGIGLGLQSTISNFVSGFTLIADKSIKPGDVIEIEDTFGWVTAMGARYVTVRTRDGTEHLVPNDKFTAEGVVNWSHADRVVRLHVAFGVSYDTDNLERVKELAEAAAAGTARVVSTPKPVCNLVAFGDSSVDFDLRLWIEDPANGITNVRSDVMFRLWSALKEEGVEIPYPQRDLRLRAMDPEAAAALSASARLHENAPRPVTGD